MAKRMKDTLYFQQKKLEVAKIKFCREFKNAIKDILNGFVKKCQHKETHYENWPDGGDIEVCDDCGMSRHCWEQGESEWIMLENIPEVRRQLRNTIDKAVETAEAQKIRIKPFYHRKLTEGTKSYLIGCHQFLLHPLWVTLAWRLEYGRWPVWWQLVCILLHDVGICGRQYLSDDNAKRGHWKRGARLAANVVIKIATLLKHQARYGVPPVLLGYYAYNLCAGHSPQESGCAQSKLFRPDKRSFLVAPILWLWWTYWVDVNKHINTNASPPPEWRRLVAKNLRKSRPAGSHELYVNNRKDNCNG